MKIVTSWFQEGRHVMRLLGRRIGNLEPETEARIVALSVGELDQLSEALLDFAVPQDLQQWLDSCTGHPLQ